MAVPGDLDGDGDVGAFIKEVSVGYGALLSDGAGTFSRRWTSGDTDAMALVDLALADVDDDGDVAAVITNGQFQSSSYPGVVFLNDGTGQLTDSGQRVSAVHSAGLALGDLDGDGDLDLVLAHHRAPCQIWFNQQH